MPRPGRSFFKGLLFVRRYSLSAEEEAEKSQEGMKYNNSNQTKVEAVLSLTSKSRFGREVPPFNNDDGIMVLQELAIPSMQ